jgi:hypothetical protein
MDEINFLNIILNNDFPNLITGSMDFNLNFQMSKKENPSDIKIINKPYRLIAIQNIDENYQHIAIIINQLGLEYKFFMETIEKFLIEIKKRNYIETKIHSKDKYSHNNQNLIFTKTIYFYTDEITIPETEIIEFFFKLGIKVIINDNNYRNLKKEIKKPDLFICHDSRDKKGFVDELYNELKNNSLDVWYDKYNLEIGDSLSEKINQGINECRFGLLILSKNFLSNEKWAKNELQTLATKQIILNKKVILPIWLDINEEDLKEYSFWLIDKVAAIANDGLSEVVRKILKVVKNK